MKSIYQVKQRISNLLIEEIPQTMEQEIVHKAKLDSLYWSIVEDHIRTPEEINRKILRYQEELFATNDKQNIYYQAKTARIKELENIINDKS